MEYRFIRIVNEQLWEMDFKKYKNIAYDMIQYGNEKLGNKRFSKYFYNSIADALKEVNKKYGENHMLPSEDAELTKELLCIGEVKKDQCIFLTFLIMTMRLMTMRKEKIVKENCNAENYKREYVNILNTFYRANDMEVLVNASMDNAILYFSLATQQPWRRWVDMQAVWNKHRTNDYVWHRKHSDWRSLPYWKFKERVSEGLSENTRKTQNTYQEADNIIAEIIDDYNKKNAREMYRKQECSVSNIFPAYVQNVMENAEWRRTWYLYRMISMGIDCQINAIIKDARIMKAPHNRRDEDRLMSAVGTCWLRTNYGTIQEKISLAVDEREMEKLLRDYLNSCPLTVENIAHVFNESLGGYGETVFVQAKYRFYHHFKELMEEHIDEHLDNQKKHSGIIHKYFKSGEVFENILRNELTGSGRNARLFYKVMSGETVTSREMLLLTALIVKKQGSQEIDRDYVFNHVLTNCRFELTLHENRAFDRFFSDSFSNIDSLYDNAMKLEKDMLQMGRGAVFYNIIRGKEV